MYSRLNYLDSVIAAGLFQVENVSKSSDKRRFREVVSSTKAQSLPSSSQVAEKKGGLVCIILAKTCNFYESFSLNF